MHASHPQIFFQLLTIEADIPVKAVFYSGTSVDSLRQEIEYLESQLLLSNAS